MRDTQSKTGGAIKLDPGWPVVGDGGTTSKEVLAYPNTEINRLPALVQRAAEVFKVPAEVIMSDSRVGRVVKARMAIVYVLRERRALSYCHIGSLLNRHHTTIINSLERASHLRERDPNFAAACEHILPAR